MFLTYYTQNNTFFIFELSENTDSYTYVSSKQASASNTDFLKELCYKRNQKAIDLRGLPKYKLHADIYNELSDLDYSKQIALYLFTTYGGKAPTEIFNDYNFPNRLSSNIKDEYYALSNISSLSIDTNITHSTRKVFNEKGEITHSIFESGVIVDLSIGRWRGQTSLSSSDLGLTLTRESDSKLVDLGKKLLLPRNTLKELDSIEARSRGLLKKYAIQCPWGFFVPTHSFEKWHTENEVVKQEYLNKAVSIVANLDSLIASVIKDYINYSLIAYRREQAFNTNLPSDMSTEWQTAYIKAIKSKIPSAQDIKKSFSYTSSYLQIPISLIDPKVSQIIKTEIDPKLFYKGLQKNILSEFVTSILELNNFSDLKNKDETLNQKAVKKLHKTIDTFKSKGYNEDPTLKELLTLCDSCRGLSTNDSVTNFIKVINTFKDTSIKLLESL